MISRQICNSLLLALAAFIWGIAFVAQRKGGDIVGPYTFNCLRSFIGALVLLPVIRFRDAKGANHPEHRPVSGNRRDLLLGGISCGVMLCLATNAQQLGMYYGTTAGKAGFLTACYILLVPILGLFLYRKSTSSRTCPWNVWLAVGIALIGLYFLCISGRLAIQPSDLVVLTCALVFAVHILTVEHFSPRVDRVRMSCLQFAVCGLLTAIPMIFLETGFSLGSLRSWASTLTSLDAWIPLLYAGVLSCGVAYTLQIIGQNGLNSTIASLVMSLESVFSALAGWAILKERLTGREITGCVLIFFAILLAQISFKKSPQNSSAL